MQVLRKIKKHSVRVCVDWPRLEPVIFRVRTGNCTATHVLRAVTRSAEYASVLRINTKRHTWIYNKEFWWSIKEVEQFSALSHDAGLETQRSGIEAETNAFRLRKTLQTLSYPLDCNIPQGTLSRYISLWSDNLLHSFNCQKSDIRHVTLNWSIKRLYQK
jgi:hypothetical protein